MWHKKKIAASIAGGIAVLSACSYMLAQGGQHGYHGVCTADAPCVPARTTFGYYPTAWRRWPTDAPMADTRPAPEQLPAPGSRESLPEPEETTPAPAPNTTFPPFDTTPSTTPEETPSFSPFDDRPPLLPGRESTPFTPPRDNLPSPPTREPDRVPADIFDDPSPPRQQPASMRRSANTDDVPVPPAKQRDEIDDLFAPPKDDDAPPKMPADDPFKDDPDPIKRPTSTNPPFRSEWQSRLTYEAREAAIDIDPRITGKTADPLERVSSVSSESPRSDAAPSPPFSADDGPMLPEMKTPRPNPLRSAPTAKQTVPAVTPAANWSAEPEPMAAPAVPDTIPADNWRRNPLRGE